MTKKCNLPEVPGLDVVVETDAIGAAILGDDLHDFLLLLWREQVLAMMITVVGTKASTEEKTHITACLGPLIVWHIVIEVGEAPCFLHETLLAEILALTVLPGCWIDGRSVVTIFGQQQPGLIMHARSFLCALIVEAQGISQGDVFVCQFLLVHICVNVFACKDTNK